MDRNTDGTDFADWTDLCSRCGLHGKHVSIAQPQSGCQDQANQCDQSNQCSDSCAAGSCLRWFFLPLAMQSILGSYGQEVISRFAMDGACSIGDFSRWYIVTLIELISLIGLICAAASGCTANRLVLRRRKPV